MTRIPIPAYIGSNTQYLNLPFFHFCLRGQGNSKELLFEPPLLHIEETLLLNTEYVFTTKILKTSEGNASFTLALEGKSSELFDIGIETPTGICDGQDLIHCETNTNELELKVILKSYEIGEQTAYFVLNPVDGNKICFSCTATFGGP